jgi:hypothetical protein
MLVNLTAVLTWLKSLSLYVKPWLKPIIRNFCKCSIAPVIAVEAALRIIFEKVNLCLIRRYATEWLIHQRRSVDRSDGRSPGNGK